MILDKIDSSIRVLDDIAWLLIFNRDFDEYDFENIVKVIKSDSRFHSYCSMEDIQKTQNILQKIESFSKEYEELENSFRINELQAKYHYDILGREMQQIIQDVFLETEKHHTEVLFKKEIINLIKGKTLIEDLKVMTYDIPATRVLIKKGTTITEQDVDTVLAQPKLRDISGLAFDKETSDKFYDLMRNKFHKIGEKTFESFGVIDGVKLYKDINKKLRERLESKTIEQIEEEVSKDIHELRKLYIELLTFLEESKGEISSLSKDIIEIINEMGTRYNEFNDEYFDEYFDDFRSRTWSDDEKFSDNLAYINKSQIEISPLNGKTFFENAEHLSETVKHIQSEIIEMMYKLNKDEDFDGHFSDGDVFEKYHSKVSNQITDFTDLINKHTAGKLEDNFESYYNRISPKS